MGYSDGGQVCLHTTERAAVSHVSHGWSDSGGVMRDGVGRREREPDWARLEAMIDALAERKGLMTGRATGELRPSWRKLGELVNPGNPTILYNIRLDRTGRRRRPSAETLAALAYVAGDDPAVWYEVGGLPANTAVDEESLDPLTRDIVKLIERRAPTREDKEEVRRLLDLYFRRGQTSGGRESDG